MSTSQRQELPKWLVTVPLLMLLLCVLIATLPLTLIIALLASLIPAYRGSVRALLFLLCFVVCETAGVIIAGAIWIRYRNQRQRFINANYSLQFGWSAALMNCARYVFDLTFHVHNTEALEGPAALMLPRHTSIADTVLPMTYYAIPQNTPLRYILKKELQWDPCLEIVGNRLPNYFVDRVSHNSEAEVANVIALLDSTPPNEAILLYPEGTRFSALKHKQLKTKASTDPTSELAQQLSRWPKLLPPRLGGCLGLLSANKHHDLLFFGHSGFEGSANFIELMNGSWTHSHVHLEFWRVPYEDIPTDTDQQKEFLFQQWDKMHDTVERLEKLRGR